MGHRALPLPVPGVSGYLSLLSLATKDDGQREEILISLDSGPDWLGRQDQTVLVSSSSLSLKVSLISPSGFHPAAASKALKVPE